MLALLHAADGPYRFTWHVHGDVVVLCTALLVGYFYAITQLRDVVSDAGRVRRGQVALYCAGVASLYLVAGTPVHDISEQYLLNKWKAGEQRFKLLPTQADRGSYHACLDATPAAGGPDAVGAAYRFFKAALVEADDPEDDQDIDRIEDAVISGLALVSVTAQAGDSRAGGNVSCVARQLNCAVKQRGLVEMAEM